MSFYLKKYMWLISLVAVVLCSYFLAKMTANFIAMQFDGRAAAPSIRASQIEIETGERKSVAEDLFEPIIERNIFDSRDVRVAAAQVEEEELDEEALTDEAVLTSLPIKLISTFSVGKGEDKRSTCIISKGKGKKGAEDVYTVADENQFAPDTRIIRILFDRVEFVNKKRLEYVELEDFAKVVALNVPPRRDEGKKPTRRRRETKTEEAKIEKSSEGKFVIDRAEIDDAIANLDKLYTQIRAVPHFKEGRPNGLKLLSVRSGSIFSKLGLKRGDILQRINGMELDIKKGLEIFNRLKTETSINIDIERRGNVQSLEYEIR